MMKTSIKLLAILLALLSVLACFAGCNGEEETEDKEINRSEQTSSTETVTETETEAQPDFEKKNYDETLYFQTYGSTYLNYFWVEESKGDVISEALYARQQKIEDYLGVTIMGTVAAGDHLTYDTAFKTSVKNKDGAIDLFFTNAYTCVPGLITGGYIRDLQTMDTLNLEADYWNLKYMTEISLTGKYYLGYNDFCVPKTYMIVFNKIMMEQYADSLGGTVYDLVNNYQWTIDQMISLANLVYIDQTGDGKTEDDTFGITGQQWIPFIPFLHASNIQLVEQTEKGDYEVSVYNDKNMEKTFTLAQKLKELAGGDSAWFRFRIEDTPMIPLTTGRTLMSLVGSSDLEGYLEYDISFGVLPYPMYDEAQKDIGYRSLNFDGYVVVPTYLENETMVGETAELLAFYGEPVQTAVFEKMLGKQVADTPKDAAMLDIIWNNICSDVGLTYSHIDGSLDNNLYMLPWVTNPNGTDEVASYVAGYEKKANKAFQNLMKQLGKLK